jgi:predicted lipase
MEFEKDPYIKIDAFFYMIFSLIKNDIFNELILSEIIKNEDYQIIFTGHSFGGAIATLASNYFYKEKF